MPASKEFEDWPDGHVIMRPTYKAADMAVTKVERYESPVHIAFPTAAHRSWEASQRKWAAVAAAADADDAAQRDQGAAGGDQGAAGEGEQAGWVPQPGAGLPTNQYLIHFESDIFVGKMLVYIKGLPSSYEPYFEGKKRRSVLMIQVGAGWAGYLRGYGDGLPAGWKEP
jgi:hypothetical protein